MKCGDGGTVKSSLYHDYLLWIALCPFDPAKSVPAYKAPAN